MSQTPNRPATAEGLFLWVMHRFAEVFADHAILKGGMALRLLDSPRSTTDIDYVFVPYESKKEILAPVEELLHELEDAVVEVKLHSKNLRATVRLDDAAIQVEVNVARACAAMPLATADFARAQGRPSAVVRVMALDQALAHKLAAWNERRLLRDLYDAHFLGSILGEAPALEVLDERLRKIESRLPALKGRREMSRADLAAELRRAAVELTESRLQEELAPLLPPGELAGLLPRLRGGLERLADRIVDD